MNANGPPACAMSGFLVFTSLKIWNFDGFVRRELWTDGIAYAGCYKCVGPPVTHGPGIGAEFDFSSQGEMPDRFII